MLLCSSFAENDIAESACLLYRESKSAGAYHDHRFCFADMLWQDAYGRRRRIFDKIPEILKLQIAGNRMVSVLVGPYFTEATTL
jgi:hypothetical protein